MPTINFITCSKTLSDSAKGTLQNDSLVHIMWLICVKYLEGGWRLPLNGWDTKKEWDEKRRGAHTLCKLWMSSLPPPISGNPAVCKFLISRGIVII